MLRTAFSGVHEAYCAPTLVYFRSLNTKWNTFEYSITNFALMLTEFGIG